MGLIRRFKGQPKTLFYRIVDVIAPMLGGKSEAVHNTILKSFTGHKGSQTSWRPEAFQLPSNRAQRRDAETLEKHIRTLEKHTRWIRACRAVVLRALAGLEVRGTAWDMVSLAKFDDAKPRPQTFKRPLVVGKEGEKLFAAARQSDHRKAACMLRAEAIRIALSMEKVHGLTEDWHKDYRRTIARMHNERLSVWRGKAWEQEKVGTIPPLPLPPKMGLDWEVLPIQSGGETHDWNFRQRPSRPVDFEQNRRLSWGGKKNKREMWEKEKVGSHPARYLQRPKEHKPGEHKPGEHKPREHKLKEETPFRTRTFSAPAVGKKSW